MRVRMKVGVSGPRHDGRDWPAVGGDLVVPDWEAADLCTAGLATPVGESEVETAVVDVDAEQRDNAPNNPAAEGAEATAGEAAEDALPKRGRPRKQG